MAKQLPRIPTFVDLFSGCGGISLGFQQAGFRCLLAVDSDPYAVDCYNQHLRGDLDSGAVEADLGEIDSHAKVRQLLVEHGMKASTCDVLVGGPPCQSFSVVGRNKVRALVESNGDMAAYWREKERARTNLFEVYVRFLETLQPRWFLFENVPAIRSHAVYRTIQERFRHLRSADGAPLRYEIAEDVYLASDYGVPQERRRFLMVGHRSDLEITEWSRPERIARVTVAEALDDLPAIPNGAQETVIEYDSEPTTAYQALMREGLPPGEQDLVLQHVCRNHNIDDVALFERMGPGARFGDAAVQRAIREINPEHKLIKYSADKFIDKLHRLDPDRSSWTVTAHLQKDCYKFIHHREARTISVREAARLQSFPDRFSFEGFAMGPAFRLIGNAVPPRLAEAFARSFIVSDPGLSKMTVPAVEELVPDEVWGQVQGYFASSGFRTPGRPRLSPRQVMAAWVYTQQSGGRWSDLPRGGGLGNPAACRRYINEWKQRGIWEQVERFMRNNGDTSTQAAA
jgi:DNA (cytosine-5)-methyltransferase 1